MRCNVYSSKNESGTKQLSPLNHHLLLLVKTSFIVVYMVSSENMTFFLEVRNDSDKDCNVADRQETGFQITPVQSITKYF